MNRAIHILKTLAIASFVMLGIYIAPPYAVGKQRNTKPRPFAQKLVERIHAEHPETDEIGIAVTSSRGGCRTIASTDPGDIGEACEREDLEPIETGRPYIERESEGLDISVPLHDKSGKLVGSAAIGFKPRAGQNREALIDRATKIADEMGIQISSKAVLLEPGR